MIRIDILSDYSAGIQTKNLMAEMDGLRDPGDYPVDGWKTEGHAKDVQFHETILSYLPPLSVEAMKKAIRNRGNIFCRAIPRLDIQEARELVDLESEAECFSQIFLPVLFTDDNLQLLRKLISPMLIDIRSKSKHGNNLDDHLFNVILFLTVIENSELKRIDVGALEGEEKSFVLDLRLAFSSGSVARLIFSDYFPEDNVVVEIFQKNRNLISISEKPLNNDERLAAEKNALNELINAIQNKPAMLVSLHNVLQAKKIFAGIKDKLKRHFIIGN